MSIRLSDPNNWNRSSTNRWCDLIELHCLYSDDHFYSSADALEIVFFKTEELDEAEEAVVHAEVSDNRSLCVEDIFENLRMRKNALGELYPFKVERNTIETQNDNVMNEKPLYIFLLLCSNLCFVDRENVDKLTREFEKCSYYAMKSLVSNIYQIDIFGTSRTNSLFVGNVRERIRKLAELLNTRTTTTFDGDKRFDAPSGDAGIDIVAFAPIDSEAFLPLIMAQCACSYDKWKSKQYEINEDKWNKVFDNLAPYIKMMFVPFLWRENNGEFLNKTEITTCLIDRLRLIQLLYQGDDYDCYMKDLISFIELNKLNILVSDDN